MRFRWKGVGGARNGTRGELGAISQNLLGAEMRNDIPRATSALSGKDNKASGSMGAIFPAGRAGRDLRAPGRA